jgi:hypothetical protein
MKIKIDQLENLDSWLLFYKKHGKLPHKQIICGNCKNSFVSLKGRGKKVIFDMFDNNIKRILTESKCKVCRAENKQPIDKKKKEVYIETEEERLERIEKIRASIPKIDLQKERVVLDLVKDKDMCAKHTDSCLRPDIYLDNDRTCDYCELKKHCSCRLKKFSKFYEKKYKK